MMYTYIILGGIINENNEHRPGDGLGKNFRQELTMQCVPFYSVIKALGNPTIDFMSLDIEGTELQVLKTIPFNQVDIRVSSIYKCVLIIHPLITFI